MMKHFLTLFAFCAMFIATGCDDDTAGPSTPAPWTASTQNFSVSAWQNDAVYFDSTSAKAALKNADTATQRYTFDANHPVAKNLAPGKVFLIHGVALRKVATVSNQGGNLMVTTERATLNEAIKTGTIEWDQGIDFTSAVLPVVVGKKGEEIPLKAVGRDSFEIKMKYGAYDFTIFIRMRGEDAYVKMDVEKKVTNGVKGRFTTEGTLKRFRSKAKIVYIDGEPIEVGMTNDQLNGDMTLSITVAGSGQDALAGFEFPAVLFKFPYMAGPLPTVLNVKALFVINGVVPAEGSSQVSVKFGFNSQTGFRYAGKTVNVNGQMGDVKVVNNKTETGAASPIGINYGIAFPRVEVSMFGESIVPWMQTAFLVGGFYQPGVKPCQLGLANYIGAVGYDLSFLGVVDIAKGSKTLWDKKDTLLKAGNCN